MGRKNPRNRASTQKRDREIAKLQKQAQKVARREAKRNQQTYQGPPDDPFEGTPG